jgi:hypothetical protein
LRGRIPHSRLSVRSLQAQESSLKILMRKDGRGPLRGELLEQLGLHV